MSWTTFLIVFVIVAVCQLLFRVLPVAVFSDKPLPKWLENALDFVPVAAFSALVVNDLFKPENFSAGWIANLIPLIASIPVIIVARKTGSLLWCIVVGVVMFALLFFLNLHFF